MKIEQALERLGKMFDAVRRGENGFREYLEKNPTSADGSDGPFMKFVQTGDIEKGKFRYNWDD
ncbi:hypothetical protein [Pseudodesulfovibrio sediminis]|uniref:Uncharacterized protein n=1 Tax=Pseudodesulfovibrio sediminis TaxID=2810563 RepID=A0ABM7P627_9BACT|nr:hypothetical protein [Pseudodesulfovibrio sediminis]BCS88317.1 hypothetical protein PSDVSF_15590 [Pseudodesulfovibrio sediminis]